LLSIILYSDATNCDTLGKSSLHPIYISLGNISIWRRNKPDAKQLLGYLPIIKSFDITERRSQAFKNIVRETFHKSLEILLEPLTSMKNGLDLTINDKNYWFFPKISVVIADWPEAATFCLTFKSLNSNNPCHFCLVTKDNLSNLKLLKKDMIPRNHQNMCESLQFNLEKNVSIESISNFFWRFP
jgi:Plavaka transposase